MKATQKSYFKEVSRYSLLTKEEEISLAQRMERGEQAAREELINYNLRLVISITKRYADIGLPFADLIQTGNIGLIKAADMFDYRNGYSIDWDGILSDHEVLQRKSVILLK